MAKEKLTGKQVLDEARKNAPENYGTDYWPVEGETDDTDRAPIMTSDGAPRRYWVIEPGSTLFGHYMGCEVLDMPKFGHPDVREERGFFVFEIATPPGYKEEKPYGVKVRRPRVKDSEIASVGDVVFVGVRARLQPYAMFSSLDYQPLVGIRVREREKTARGFNLWGFDVRAWDSDRPAMRLLAEKDDVAAMFSAQDRGLYAAQSLYGLVIPEKLLDLATRQKTKKAIEAGQAPIAIPANAASIAESAQKSIPAKT